MTIELIRVDERLLHGQVLVAWGKRLGLRWYVVADDELAGSPWEQELYTAGLTEGVEASFVDVSAAAAELGRLDRREEPGALLLRHTEALRRLAEAGVLEGKRVNLGCLPAGEGRREAVPYVHLSPGEAEDVRAAIRAGVELRALDVPDAVPVPAEELLEAVDAG